MVNFDNFGGLTSVLKFHISLIFNCEKLVRIRVICEGLVRFFSDEKNWYSIFTNVKNRYQSFTPVKFHKCEEPVPNAHRCEKSNQSIAGVKIVSPILTQKNWLRHLAVTFLKQSNNLNNIGRGCPTDHSCPILLKSDQKFLTRF